MIAGTSWLWRSLITHQPVWVSNVSNLTSITVLGALAALYHRFTCNTPRCYRIARHPVEGTTYRTCHRHTTTIHHKALTALHAVRRPAQHKHLEDRR